MINVVFISDWLSRSKKDQEHFLTFPSLLYALGISIWQHKCSWLLLFPFIVYAGSGHFTIWTTEGLDAGVGVYGGKQFWAYQ